MADVIITRRGGNTPASGGAVFGAIETEYPKNSVCTCTGLSRGKKLSAGNSGGKLIFALPYADTWTVSAVQGEKSVSEAALISEEERYKKVRLSFETVYFDGGNVVSYSGGWHSRLGSGNNLALSIHAGASSTYDVGIYGTSNEQISLAGINTLYIKVSELSGCMNAFFYFAEAAGGEMGIYAIPKPAQKWELKAGDNEIDVAAYEGAYYFGFCIVEAKGSTEAASVKVSRIAGE